MRIPYIHESGLIGIGFSLVVVVIASLNLVLDVYMLTERGAEAIAARPEAVWLRRIFYGVEELMAAMERMMPRKIMAVSPKERF